MTSLPGRCNGSCPSNNTTTPIPTIGVNRILPIMSAPPPPSRTSSMAHQDGQQSLQFQNNNHRRKPPELEIARPQQYQQYGGMDARKLSLPTYEQHPGQLNDSRVSSVGDSGMGLDSSTGSHSGQYSRHQPGAGPQPMPLDSSGGSGNSSGSEGRPMGDSSGRSSVARLTRQSTAEDWFNTFNRDVRGNQSYPNYENDSPYYMPNHHRKKHQQSGRYPRPAKTHHGGFPDRGAPESFRGIPHGVLDSTEESNSDSFRSVIDDLTIKNQKLKKRLRKLEGLHGHTTHAERLFEVRVHDLPEAKKAELEKLLQSFTASIDAESLGQGSSLRSNVTPGNRSSAIDSGYASVSRSGNDFSMPPTRDPNCDESMRMWSAAQTNSELKKMKLVVCRLEQLFTGGEAAVVGDRKVLQQQDISNIAAAEDQEAKLLAGEQVDTEGAREASMMSPPRNNSQDSLSSTDEPEQRPTRPLDLDPQREQVPEDNIEYLTHMTESSIKGSGPQNGWVYLNLIINLAQLHTINVTPPFIKKAIAAASSRLELSADGKMVRWKGNDGSQCNGSGGDGSSEQSPGSGGIRRSADGKSFGSGCESQSGSSGCGSGPGVSALQAREPHRFHYRPIFARSQSFDDDSSSCITSDTDSQEQKRSSSSESRGAGSKKSDTGPIIFYKGGGFCTDLSSQPLREDEELNDEMPTRYVRATTRPLGSIGSTFRHPPSPSTKDESPLYREGMVIPEEDVMEIDRDDDQSVIEFSPQFTATSTIPPVPIEFEASGIGGVLPADNFAINCETKHYLLPENHGRLPVTKSRALKSNLQKRILHRIPKASMDAFYDQDNMTDSSIGSTESKASKSIRPARGRALRHELLSANTLKLPPSSLPPASYIFASPSEDSSSNGETDDDAPRSSGSEGYFFQQAGLDAYRNPSLDEDEAGIIFQRSPSSAATAGDGSRTSSVFSDRNVEDPTYEGPLSMDSEQSSSVGSGYVGLMPPAGSRLMQQSDAFDLDRPSLKRSRGSVISSSSNQQVRKSARMQSSSLQNSSDDS